MTDDSSLTMTTMDDNEDDKGFDESDSEKDKAGDGDAPPPAKKKSRRQLLMLFSLLMVRKTSLWIGLYEAGTRRSHPQMMRMTSLSRI